MKNQALELHSPLPKSFKACKERTTEREKAVKKAEDSSYSLPSHFWSTFRSPFSTCYISFQSSGSQKSNASNGARFGVEMKELQPLQADHSKLKEIFARLRNHPFVVINFVDYSLNQGAPAGHESAKTPIRHESNGAVAGDGATLHCACHIEYEIAEEAMNFMRYVAEVSRGWDEPNARDMGRMKSQPNAKGEMYILDDGIDMRTKFAAMERRLEKLEMTNMQPCPTIPAVWEMFGDCNTYNSNWRDHPNFFWKPQPPRSSNLEQAMMNLNKVMEDFVEAKKSINAQLSQRIDSVESSLNKKMDQGIHEVEAQEGESSMVKEVKTVITLSGKEVDLPTCKLEHKRTTEDSHQGRKNDETHASTFSPSFVWENHTNQVSRGIAKKLKESRLEQEKSKNRGKTRVYEISQPLRNRHFAVKPVHSLRPLSAKIFAAAKPSLAHECHFAAQESPFRSCKTAAKPQRMKIPDFAAKLHSVGSFVVVKPIFGTRLRNHFWHTSATSQRHMPISQLRNGLRKFFSIFSSPLGCETLLWLRNHFTRRNGLQIAKLTCEMEEGEPRTPGDHTHKASHSISNLLKPSEPIAPAEETMPPKETIRTKVKVLIQPTQEATTNASAPQDLTIT
ncbi:hypothetical protein AAG906_012619 [Vitis piasezkii]